MAPLALNCPLCCNETFSSHNFLKYHLLSMLDNLICPSCNKRCDDLMDLVDHLDKECKNLAKDNTAKVYGNLKVSKANEVKEALEESNNMSDENTVLGPPVIKKEIDDSSLENSGDGIINDNGKDENGVQENVNSHTEMLYNCQMCNISFNSVKDHLEKYHEGEEVLLETDEHSENFENEEQEETVLVYQDEEQQGMDIDGHFDNVDDPDKVDPLENHEGENNETISEENLVSTDGMPYTRKIVKIGSDWRNDETENLNPITTKYIVENGQVRKITEEEASQIDDKLSIIEVHSCPNCNLQFPNINHFLKHKCSNAKPVSRRRDRKLVKVKEELRYQCTFCQAIYSSLIALNDHMKAHLVHDESGMVYKKTITMSFHVCDVCNTKFPSFKQLRLHSRMHDPVKAKKIDPPVSYNIMGENTDEAEESSSAERQTFQCPVCEKFYDKEYEEVHLKSHEVQENNICFVCNRKFDTRENLDMHMKAHSDTKKFACSYCKKPFTNYQALENHVVNQCQKRQYECQYCGRRFARPHEKVKHERIHTGEKPHVCQLCGKAFRVSYCLTLHMRTHSGTRPYSCQHCGKRFKSHSVYNHHMLTHSEERNYKCPFCPKAFKTAVQLAGHKNSHTKPFSCTECNRPFASLYAVRGHMETHKRDNNLRFDCWICGASYARSFALRDHMNSVHAEENQQDDNILENLENQQIDDNNVVEDENPEPEGSTAVEEDGDSQVKDESENTNETSHQNDGRQSYVVLHVGDENDESSMEVTQ